MKILKLIVQAIAVVIVVGGALVYLDQQKDKKEVDSSVALDSAITVTAAQVAMEYATNELAADSKFKGKSVILVGIVLTVGKDEVNDPFVDLYSTIAQLPKVRANLRQDAIPQAAKLIPGSQTILACVGDGKTEVPEFKSCRVLDRLPNDSVKVPPQVAPATPTATVQPSANATSATGGELPKDASECVKVEYAKWKKEHDIQTEQWCSDLQKKGEECRISAGQEELVAKEAILKIEAKCTSVATPSAGVSAASDTTARFLKECIDYSTKTGMQFGGMSKSEASANAKTSCTEAKVIFSACMSKGGKDFDACYREAAPSGE